MRRRRAVALAGVACLALAAIVGFAGREPRLMDRATMVGDISPMDLAGRRLWLSDDRLLVVDVARRLRIRDLRSGTDAPASDEAASLSRRLGAWHPAMAAPGGKWVAAESFYGAWKAVLETNGTREHRLPGNLPWGHPRWLADGSGLLWFAWPMAHAPHEALVYRLDRWSTPEAYSLPAGLRGKEVVAAPTVRSVITLVGGPHVYERTVSTWDLPARKRTHCWTFRLPGSAYEAAVSPAGDRIGWLVSRDPSAWSRWLARRLPVLHMQLYGTNALYVSRLDGSNMRLVGATALDTDPRQTGAFDGPDGLQWLPSGKALSFEYRDALYTVAAD